MPKSRTRKNRGKGAGAVERRRRNDQHNEVVRERQRQLLGVAPNDPLLFASVALLTPKRVLRKAGKIR